MTEQSIDKFTGLPQLPDGQYWNVRETCDRLGEGRSRVLRVEARKRIPCRTHMIEVGETRHPTVLEALRNQQYRRKYSPMFYRGGPDVGPWLWGDDFKLVNQKTKKTEHFKPKRLFRKPELDHISYQYEADVLWDEHEVLFYAETRDFSEEGILEAAERAIEDHDRRTEHERFVNRVSGDYPPKKLEAQ